MVMRQGIPILRINTVLLFPYFLIFKAPITTAADNFFFFFFFIFQRKQVDISYELSAWQMIHMKCQDLFSLTSKKKYF